MSDKKILIFKRNNQLLTALLSDKKLVEVHVNEETFKSLVGNIYIGRVQNIVKNIEAAFVEIQKGFVCYLPLTDIKNPIFTNRLSKDTTKPLCVGDELVVQVIRDGLKTNQPAVSTNISISGDFVVLSYGDDGIGISTKIKGEKRNRLKLFLEETLSKSNQDTQWGFVLRTNAGTLCEEEFFRIQDERIKIQDTFQQILSIATYRPAFTCLYSKKSNYSLEQIYREDYEEIVTDQKEVYEELKKEKEQEKLEVDIRYYNDEYLTLMNLYGIESKIKEALGERIWLKSGGYLIIEPTEALTVIDVNTGKFEGNFTSSEETMLKINLEAAKEVAWQLRLRNLSGIIIVDFVNMDIKEHQNILLNTMQQAVSHDPVQTNVVGFTRLGLMEITRKKRNKPLKDLINEKTKEEEK